MKQAVILAAGEGQRLRPFTVTRPKTMLSIAAKPILEYVVESLAHNGIRDIVIVVGYRKEQVFDYMGDGKSLGVTIRYIIQDSQLGTAHALAQAEPVTEDEFMVLPGDNLIEPETIQSMCHSGPTSVLVKKTERDRRYGMVKTDKNAVLSIIENPETGDGELFNTGIYCFSREIFKHIESRLGIPDVINDMIAEGSEVSALETTGTWLDVVYPWDMLELNHAILKGIPSNLGGTIETGASVKGPVSIGKGTVIRSNSYIIGPAVIGSNCIIGPNTCILPSTSIGNNVVLSAFCQIENSVIGNDVNIGPASIVQDSVIDESCLIKGHLSACSDEVEVRINGGYQVVTGGAMMGIGCRLGNNVVAQPGVILGNYSRVQPMKLISGTLPDKSSVY